MKSINRDKFEQFVHLLPESFAQVVTIIGVEASYQLVNQYGGTSFPIGQNIRKAGKLLHYALAQVVGEDNATRIEIALRGQRDLYIPKCDTLMRELRNIDIREQFDEMTTRQQSPVSGMLAARHLALTYHLSERQVWNILNSPAIMLQNDLFAA